MSRLDMAENRQNNLDKPKLTSKFRKGKDVLIHQLQNQEGIQRGRFGWKESEFVSAQQYV